MDLADSYFTYLVKKLYVNQFQTDFWNTYKFKVEDSMSLGP